MFQHRTKLGHLHIIHDLLLWQQYKTGGFSSNRFKSGWVCWLYLDRDRLSHSEVFKYMILKVGFGVILKQFLYVHFSA